MLKKMKPVSMILLVSSVCSIGNIYTAFGTANQNTDILRQNERVTGVVEDTFGPVAGASVLIKGTTRGTMTDMDGRFTLDNLQEGDIIQISFIGYITQEIPYTGQSTLTIRLEEDTQK